MRYDKYSLDWQEIIAANYLWFSPRTLKFWGSTIYWATLTAPGEVRYFITREHHYDANKFSIRSITDGSQIDTIGEFGQYTSLSEAKANLAKLLDNRLSAIEETGEMK
jgi:hypothetical protein